MAINHQVLPTLRPPDHRGVQDVQELEELHLHPGGAGQALCQTGLLFHSSCDLKVFQTSNIIQPSYIQSVAGTACIFASLLEGHPGLQRQHDGAGARLREDGERVLPLRQALHEDLPWHWGGCFCQVGA